MAEERGWEEQKVGAVGRSRSEGQVGGQVDVVRGRGRKTNQRR